ncbi:hypothetical protein C8Q76DRAFT_579998, partial [Earliella scabrosa]
GRGLLGTCDAYYGTVEAQGRGTLHCHMLVWLKGHPSPKEMKERMVDSHEYQQLVFKWLESIIKSELLGTTEVVTDAEPRRPRRSDDTNNPHPAVVPAPRISEMSPAAFDREYEWFVNELVKEFQWHEHTGTCWKYLRRGQPKDNAHCRMRMDGSTRESTVFREDGPLEVRRYHPWIANYNDLIIFLLKSNMDIKHIGPGQDAEALIFYLTDYVTK